MDLDPVPHAKRRSDGPTPPDAQLNDDPPTATEREEAQTQRQAPDNATPGEAAGG